MRWTKTLMAFGILTFAAQGMAQPWVRNMVDQPSIKPQETAHPLPPEGAVPVQGYEPKRTWDEGETLKNPLSPTPEVLQRGKKLWDRLCFPCHGNLGDPSGGPVSKRVPTFAVPDLSADVYVKVRKDGYFYEIIRQGHAIMPPYYEGTTPEDRWAIVLYLRHLQQERRKGQ